MSLGEPHQLNKIISHSLVIFVHGMDHSIDQGLLVPLAQLRHIAKVHITYSAVLEGENVAWMWVSVEKTKLRQRSSGQIQGLQIFGL